MYNVYLDTIKLYAYNDFTKNNHIFWYESKYNSSVSSLMHFIVITSMFSIFTNYALHKVFHIKAISCYTHWVLIERM